MLQLNEYVLIGWCNPDTAKGTTKPSAEAAPLAHKREPFRESGSKAESSMEALSLYPFGPYGGVEK